MPKRRQERYSRHCKVFLFLGTFLSSDAFSLASANEKDIGDEAPPFQMVLEATDEVPIMTILSFLNNKDLTAFSQTSRISHLNRHRYLYFLADKGGPDAQYYMGLQALKAWHKDNKEEDRQAALNWLTYAAEQGHERAAHLIIVEEIRQASAGDDSQELAAIEQAFDEFTGGREIGLPATAGSQAARQPLGEEIIRLTNAQVDVRRQVLYELELLLPPDLLDRQSSYPTILKDAWKYLAKLENPEDFIAKRSLKKELQNSKKQLQKNAVIISEDHPSFELLMRALEALRGYQRELEKLLLPDLPTYSFIQFLKKGCDSLENYYKDYLQDIIFAAKNFVQGTNDIQAKYGDELNELLAHKVAMLSESFSYPFYRISRHMALYLLCMTETGERKERPAGQNHHVSCISSSEGSIPKMVTDPRFWTQANSLYFKNQGQPSLSPEREMMLYQLYDLLDIPIPKTAVVVIDNLQLASGKKGDSAYFTNGCNTAPFFLQASWGIHGDGGEAVFKHPDNHIYQLNKEAYAKQVMGVLLSCPSDGKCGNFILAFHEENPQPSYTLISIDNDEVFAKSVEKVREGRERVHLKSVLLALPQMSKSLPESIRQYFLNLNPELLTLEWLSRLQHHNSLYESLKKYLAYLRKGEDGFNPDLSLSITLPYNQLTLLQHRLKLIQTQLQDNQNSNLFDVFTTLYPSVAYYYQEKKEALNDPYKVIAATYHQVVVDKTREYEDATGDQADCDLLIGPSLGEGSSQEFCLNDLQPSLLPLKLMRKIEIDHQTFAELVIKCTLAQPSLTVERICERLRILSRMQAVTLKSRFPIVELYRLAVQKLPHDEQNKEYLHQVFLHLINHNPHLNLAWAFLIEKMFTETWSHTHSSPQSLQEIKGAFFGKKVLSISIQGHLFNDKGNFIRRNKTGRKDVSWYPEENPNIYFKIYPEIPAYEYGATGFMRDLGIKGIPHSEVALFYDPLTQQPYPVLLSEAIPGQLVSDIWHKADAFDRLDPHHTGLSILVAMLIQVEDGNEHNYILTDEGTRLIPIDNDHAFIPATLWEKGWMGKTYEKLQMKTLLFSLPCMKTPIPDSVRQAFLKHNVGQFLQKWLTELVIVNDKYQNLVNEQVLPTLYQDPKKGTILRFPLTAEAIKQLYYRFWGIQQRLWLGQPVTYLELLKMFEPYVAKQYEAAFNNPAHQTLKDRFQSVTQGLYKEIGGQRQTASNSRSMMQVINIPHQDLIGEASKVKTGPTFALEVLNRCIMEHLALQKQNKDMLTGTEVISSPINDRALSREERIEIQKRFFTPIESMAIQYNSFLTDSFFWKLSISTMRYLDLRDALTLTSKALEAFSLKMGQLEYLNVSGWIRLKEVPLFTWPCLQRLVINNCTLLKAISLNAPKLSFLEANQNPQLQELTVQPFKLTKLSLKDCPSLSQATKEELYMQGIYIEALSGADDPQYSELITSFKNTGIVSYEKFKDLPLKCINIAIAKYPNIRFDIESLNYYAQIIYPLLPPFSINKRNDNQFVRGHTERTADLKHLKSWMLNYHAQMTGGGDYYCGPMAGDDLAAGFKYMWKLGDTELSRDNKTSLLFSIMFCGPVNSGKNIGITNFTYLPRFAGPIARGLTTNNLLFDYKSAKILGSILVKYYYNLRTLELLDIMVTKKGAATFRQFIPYMDKIKRFVVYVEVKFSGPLTDLVKDTSYDYLIPEVLIEKEYFENLQPWKASSSTMFVKI
ncbi:hypothetical protein [Candidatus Odyssella acanthamoebae]|uniref:Uncharacterized protein n=1 Tax=Candidatus Odyssella acanthamoebae TaxID=91604 RepID=A0A077ATP8_9PROT|nr:hypothetical protein [Candidatus Paracaedibacter acanthamoebae]AIK96557.1 hypothetical protein ID47_07130 [Candidatus Paracaedibacter acanthamoebae]